jgi:AraC family transcriptional regulator
VQTKQNHYIQNINKTLDYIDQKLDEPFTLDDLAEVSNFSKYHFHRIFSGMIKESPFEYILRLRLEKAASFLINHPRKNITEIATKCGFSDISIFSRNFKKHFKNSPSVFRKEHIQNSNLSQIQSNQPQIKGVTSPYFCSATNTLKWTTEMEMIKNLEVKTFPNMTVAYNRNFGPYEGNTDLYQKHREELFAWAASKDLLSYKHFNYLILYHDNPKVALNTSQRMSLCVTIPPDTKTDGKIGKLEIQGGKYLLCECELSATDFPTIWEWIYGEWFPKNNFVPDDKPYFELYPEQPKSSIFKVNFCIPIKAI